MKDYTLLSFPLRARNTNRELGVDVYLFVWFDGIIFRL